MRWVVVAVAAAGLWVAGILLTRSGHSFGGVVCIFFAIVFTLACTMGPQ
jgi:hypothetical protein